MIIANQTQDLLTERALAALFEQWRFGKWAFLPIPVLVQSPRMPISPLREAVKGAEVTGLRSVIPKRGIIVMDAGL
jgi:hypothetical protein